MKSTVGACPADRILHAYLERALSAEEVEGIERHLDACPECRVLVSYASGDVSLDGETRPSSGGAASALLARGDTLGRYVILRHLGSGAMGEVYAAHDPDLDRKVALKVLRPELVGAEPGVAGRDRLMREARAMARLSHPNVVAVHDAGCVEDELFLAMELVEGVTLSEWREAAPRGVREVLEIFLAAGRGLAAAHAAGIVHRDFKPSNVLVDRSGAAKVGDFGLARPAAGSPPTGGWDPSTPAGALTRTGTVLGTPAYMAPEQHLGAPATAQSDQFAYCVALFEALHGERPFAGATSGELLAEIERGRIVGSKGRRAPPWLWKVLARGLSAAPGDRFRSLDELLGRIERGLGRPRRIGLAAAALVVSAALAVLGWRVAERELPCRGSHRLLQGVWDAPRRAGVRSSLLGTGVPRAEATVERVESLLDDYTDRWAGEHRSACEATRVHGDQSEALLDLRMRCLDEGLTRLRALTDLFTRADRQVLGRAVEAVYALPSLHRCGDVRTLAEEGPGEVRGAAADRLRPRLAELKALHDAEKLSEAARLAPVLVEEARRLGDMRLLARTLYLHGSVEELLHRPDAAEKALSDAVSAAIAGKDDRLVVEAAAKLVTVLANLKLAFRQARMWERIARAGVARFQGSPELDAVVELQIGAARFDEGRYADALGHFERARALLQDVHGGDHPEIASAESNVGLALWQLGRYEEAARAHRRALDLRSRLLGATHLRVAQSMNNLGLVLWSQGKLEQALDHHRRALRIRELLLPPDHPHIANSYSSLGLVLRGLERHREALAAHERSLEIRKRAFGPRHPDVAYSYNNMGVAYFFRGSLAAAEQAHQRALAIREEVLGKTHALTGHSLYHLGTIRAKQGRSEEALAFFTRAHEIRSRALGAKHPHVAAGLAAMAEPLAAVGRRSEARARLEEALAIQTSTKVRPAELAHTRFLLAKRIWGDGGDRVRALELARQARAGYAEARSAKKARRVEAWIAARRGARREEAVRSAFNRTPRARSPGAAGAASR